MSDELPEEFDLVVIGTGFPESCVAAAASRIGKTVLHIDPNEYYGGAYASFGLEGLNALLESKSGGSGEELRNASYKWHVCKEAGEEKQELANAEAKHEEKELEQAVASVMAETAVIPAWTQAQLLQQSRRFNLDLCPKILYAAGPLVQLLISSNICRYAEFRAVDRVCTLFRDTLLTVPCSRSDIFNTKDLSIVEKRLLMKFLTICMTYGETKSDEDADEWRGKTFRDYLLDQNVTEKIATCVMQAIAMCAYDTPFEEGMARTQRFLGSLNRYGNTPFLFPMYGCGELPQCFCRLCAVFGGVYCLKRRIDAVRKEEESGGATVVIEGKQVRAKHVVTSHGNAHSAASGTLVNGLSRGIFLTSVPLGSEELNAGGGGVNLLRLQDGLREAILIQLSHFSGVCPKGVYVFHLTTPALSDNPEADLQPFVAQIFRDDKLVTAHLLYSAYFTLTARESPASTEATPIYCTAAPYYELDYDLSIRNAREIFAKLYGSDIVFLPRAPDPEEIVIDGEDPRALSENTLPDDLRAQLRELEKSAAQMDIEEESNHEMQQKATGAQMDAE